MKIGLCLGGAKCVWDDVERLQIPYDVVVACNDIGTVWPGELDAWVTLHPEKLREWIIARAKNGHPDAKFVGTNVAHPHLPPHVVIVPYQFQGKTPSFSSGLFTAKYALEDLKCDYAILCGVPMDNQPHDHNQTTNWNNSKGFRTSMLRHMPESTAEKIRSQSGWTRRFFGSPKDLYVSYRSQSHAKDNSASE